jgi:hypothetical protein
MAALATNNQVRVGSRLALRRCPRSKSSHRPPICQFRDSGSSTVREAERATRRSVRRWRFRGATAHPRSCTSATWERSRFTSWEGPRGSDPKPVPLRIIKGLHGNGKRRSSSPRPSSRPRSHASRPPQKLAWLWAPFYASMVQPDHGLRAGRLAVQDLRQSTDPNPQVGDDDSCGTTPAPNAEHEPKATRAANRDTDSDRAKLERRRFVCHAELFEVGSPLYHRELCRRMPVELQSGGDGDWWACHCRTSRSNRSSTTSPSRSRPSSPNYNAARQPLVDDPEPYEIVRRHLVAPNIAALGSVVGSSRTSVVEIGYFHSLGFAASAKPRT